MTEHIVITGERGSGKTTIARSLQESYLSRGLNALIYKDEKDYSFKRHGIRYDAVIYDGFKPGDVDVTKTIAIGLEGVI